MLEPLILHYFIDVLLCNRHLLSVVDTFTQQCTQTQILLSSHSKGMATQHEQEISSAGPNLNHIL